MQTEKAVTGQKQASIDALLRRMTRGPCPLLQYLFPLSGRAKRKPFVLLVHFVPFGKRPYREKRLHVVVSDNSSALKELLDCVPNFQVQSKDANHQGVFLGCHSGANYIAS